jgi:hypothetical protein
MPSGVFDFDYLNKRVKELGIEPVYGSHEEKPAEKPAEKQPEPEPDYFGCG